MGSDIGSTVAYTAIQPTEVVRGRWYKWWMSAAIHALPLAFTVTLLYINFAGLFWFPASGASVLGYHVPASNILNTLQLAAKLYEILVVVSLTAIALNTYKRQLIQNGVPLGLLTGAYRIFDVLYIFSPMFWSGAKRATFLALLLIICVILCALAAPASAILIVPNLGWFKISDPFSNVYMPVSLNFSRILRPTIFREGIALNEMFGLNNTVCLTRAGVFLNDCPAAGFQNILTWAAGWQYTGLPDNITFQDSSSSVTRRLDIKSTNSGTLATSAMVNAVSAFAQFKKYIKTRDVGIISEVDNYRLRLTDQSNNYQPLAHSKCNIWNLRDFGGATQLPRFIYPSQELNCFTDSENDCTRLRDKYDDVLAPSDVWQGQEGITYKFNTISGESDQNFNTSKPSFLVFSARLPYAVNTTHAGTRVAACSVIAHWVPSILWGESKGDNLIQTNITNLALFANNKTDGGGGEIATVGPLIQFTQSWLPFLNIHIENGLPDTNQTPSVVQVSNGTFEQFPVFGPLLSGLSIAMYGTGELVFGPGSSIFTNPDSLDPEDDNRVQVVLEKLLSALIVDAVGRTLANIGTKVMRPDGEGNHSAIIERLEGLEINGTEMVVYDNGTFVYPGGEVIEQTSKTLSEWMEFWLHENVNFFFEAEQFGYGYGQSRGPLIFAIVVVLIYVLALALYMIAAIFYASDTVVAWGDLQELLVLAWTSPSPPGLQCEGKNVEGGEMWSEGVSARATASKHVNLVMEEQETGVLRLRKNETYY